MTSQRGFSLIELLVAMALSLMLSAAVLAAYSQGYKLKTHAQSKALIQANVRLGMDRLQRDLRMVGFGVPKGAQLGGTTTWMPAVFHASPTSIAFRAEIDGGNAEVVCTPKSTNVACNLTKIRLDSIDYFAALGCRPPDGGAGDLKLVASLDDIDWQPLSCTGTNTGDGSISVSGSLANGFFEAGASNVYTVEQVYLRYVAGPGPRYGRLERYVTYVNAPDATYPPLNPSWEVVATNLTDVVFVYEDGAGTALSGNPLSSGDLSEIRSIGILLEGFDESKPDKTSQIIRVRSEVGIRNVET